MALSTDIISLPVLQSAESTDTNLHETLENGQSRKLEKGLDTWIALKFGPEGNMAKGLQNSSGNSQERKNGP